MLYVVFLLSNKYAFNLIMHTSTVISWHDFLASVNSKSVGWQIKIKMETETAEENEG